jgi:EmrB/QacA subfamily drug resistance transporter
MANFRPDHAGGGAPPAAPPLDEATRRRIIMSVLAIMVLAALDTTIVATAMPTIGAALGNFEQLPWIATAYLVASTMMAPLFGKLSDIHGRRPVLYASVALFTVGSVLCAVAPSMILLIIARAIQGIGGGGTMSIPQTIIADIVPPNQRGKYQAYFSAGYGSALIAGPLLGGFFSSQLHWSLIFWINVPIVAAAVVFMRRPLLQLPQHHRPHQLDIPGAVLMAAATVTLLLALDWAAHHGWGSQSVLVLLVASVLLWAGFALRNMRAPEPLLPFAMLKDQVVALANAASAFGFAAFVGLLIVVPVFLQFALGFSIGETSFAFAVMTLASVFGSGLTGRLMQRWKQYRLIGAIGHVIAALALGTIALLATNVPFLLLEVLLAMIGAGIGTLFPLGTVAVQSAVPLHQLGIATATLSFIRSLGGTVGAATLGGLALGGTVVSDHAVPLTTAGMDTTFGIAFGGAAVFAALGALCFWLMEDRPLRGTIQQAGPPGDKR